MNAEIKVYTMGRLQVVRDGAVLDGFISTKAVLLFTYLAIHPGEHTRKKLASMLWSETTDEQALKNLRTVLSSVRQQVGDALLVSRDELALNPDIRVEVDICVFESGFKRIFSSPATLDLLRSMQELAELYQGPFLQNIVVRDANELNEWIAERQRHLQQLYLKLLLEIVETTHKQGSYESGMAYARKLVNLDPLWDLAQRHLMRLLAYANRANEALQHYEHFVRLLEDELGAEPEEETRALYEQIRSHSLQSPPSSGRVSIVLPDLPFVEPIEDVEIAQRMLNTPQCRLLTVFGISGIGKTALATQLAFHRQHMYPDGTCFVSLTTAWSMIEALQLIAGALEVNYSSSMSQEALTRSIITHLKTRDMLLVLDNYEQLLPDVEFLQSLLQETQRVQVIVTSRIQLNLYREWLLPLRGLSVPEADAEHPECYEAVRLFELTAQRINPRFNLASSLQDIIKICQLVDRLPLGIVIAAGWVQYISPAEILAMMERDLLKLEAVHQDVPSRHRSFQSLLNSMLAHLTEEEQQALMCLSIFEGSFDHKAALAVADIGMEAFRNLTNKCLVQRAEGYRYSVHSIVRQAFKPQLERSPLLQTVVARYIAYFKQWCDALYAQELPLHELMHVIDQEQHNLWNVTGLTDLDQQQFLLHIAPVLNEYWVNRGYHARGLLQILQRGGNNPAIEPTTRVRGLLTLARLLERTSQYDQAWAVCEQLLELEQALHLPHIRARALRVLSEICAIQANFEQAMTYLQEIIAMEPKITSDAGTQMARLICLAYEDLGDIMMSQGRYDEARHYIQIAMGRWYARGETLRASIARSYQGIIALKEGEYHEAYQLFADILDIARQNRNQTLIAIYASYLGTAAMHLGEFKTACEMFHDALQVALQIDRKTTIVNLMSQLAQLAIYFEHYDISAQLVGFASAMRERLNMPIMPHHLPEHEEREQVLMIYLESNYDLHYRTGHNMGLPSAVQLAGYLMEQVCQRPFEAQVRLM